MKVAIRQELGCFIVCHVAHDRLTVTASFARRAIRRATSNLVAGEPLPEHSDARRHAIPVEPCHRVDVWWPRAAGEGSSDPLGPGQ